MGSSGIGFVYHKDKFICYVDYELNKDHEANVFTGILNVLGTDGIAGQRGLLTLQLADLRKIDFSATRRVIAS
jgi:hypothetical protein